MPCFRAPLIARGWCRAAMVSRKFSFAKRYNFAYVDNLAHIKISAMNALHRMPNLAALRAFEAAARHQNFSRAASELHVTHGAISHQVRALEEELGIALFSR